MNKLEHLKKCIKFLENHSVPLSIATYGISGYTTWGPCF